MLNEIKNEMERRGYNAKVISVTKNGVIKEGVSIETAENIGANFYFHPEWDFMLVSEIADSIEEALGDASENMPVIDVNLLQDADFIMQNAKLCIQKQGIENIIKKNYLDLELYVRVYLSEEVSCKLNSDAFSIIMCNEILQAAIENSKGSFEILTMPEVIAKNLNISVDEAYKMYGIPVLSPQESQYVVHTTSFLQGASCLYYPEIFQKFCEDLDVNGCYIIPSSIHEVIIIPYMEGMSMTKEEINSMICETNDMAVEAEEQLADHCYFYDLESNQITY